jgi:AbrB family looped-hinge helix DNA binding protein
MTDKQNFCYIETVRMIVTVTERGLITLPAKLRKSLGIHADDQLIAEMTSEGLLLRPCVTLPIEIYNDDRVREFDAAEAEVEETLRRVKPV